MVPRKSCVWQYFEKKVDGTACCRICNKKLKTSGNTTNLICHMEKVHNVKIRKPHTKYPKNASTQEAEDTGNNISSAGEESHSSNSHTTNTNNNKTAGSEQRELGPAEPVVASASHSKISQKTLLKEFQLISSFKEGGARYNKLSNAILYMICKDMQPFQMVENEDFIRVLKVASPHYKIPSRTTFSRMLHSKYNALAAIFKEKLSTINNVTLTTDIWTDTQQTRSFLGVTVHFEENNKMQCAALGVDQLDERHTAEYLSQKLLITCEHWGIEKENVTAVITDSGANIVKAVEISFGKNKHIPCFAHTINLVAERSVEAVPDLCVLINKVKSIVTWFKQSVVASDELRKSTKTKLIQEVSTRWNSKYFMIKRFLEIRASVNDIVNHNTSAPEMINARQFEDLNEILDLFRPLEVATRELCGEKYVTSSIVIPMIHCVENKISQVQVNREIGLQLKTALVSEINKRFGQIEHVQILSLSTILDPRFKKIHFQDPLACSKAVKILKDLVRHNCQDVQLSDSSDGSVSGNETFTLWSDHHRLVNRTWRFGDKGEETIDTEVIQYLRSPVGRLGDQPLTMWEDMSPVYPNLSKIARKYLSIVATSVPSERLFSKAGQILTERRNRLKGNKLSMLLFLQNLDDTYWE